MKPRKGSKKKSLPQDARPQDLTSDSDNTLASLSSDDTVAILSPTRKVAGRESATGLTIVAPNYYSLPPTQQRLFHHMSSIAQSIESGGASELAIYLKELPT